MLLNGIIGDKNMGYAKYNEDDEKICSDRDYMKKGSPFRYAKETTVYSVCPYCKKVFPKITDMYKHIKEKHNIVRPLLEINGKIVSNDYYISEVENVIISLYGYKPILLIEDSNIKYDNVEKIDVTDNIKSVLSMKDTCKIDIDNDSIVIHLYDIKNISNPRIFTILNEWENKIESGQYIVPISNLNDYNIIEQRFIKAFFNYYVAASGNNEYKNKRYDDAYAALSMYSNMNGIGKCAMKIIAFRLNWINNLKALCDGDMDDFNIICDFYDMKETVFNNFDQRRVVHKLYVEDEIQKSIDMIIAYQSNDMKKVKIYLNKYKDVENITDSNMRDRVLLIMARYENKNNNKRYARFYYERINTLYFKKEAENYLANM